MNATSVGIAYGKGRIDFPLDPSVARWTVVEPRSEPALDDPRAAFMRAIAAPIGSPPLAEIVRPTDKVAVVTSDGTRPVPNRQLVPWLAEALGIPDANLTILIGTGTHRPNTPQEIQAMFGSEVAGRFAIVNHDAYDEAANVEIGRTSGGIPVRVDRLYLEADKRIALGFVEPHFFAGFSGGPKAVVPGVAGIETILRLHDYDMIDHPASAFGVLEGNPIHQAVTEAVAFAPPEFLINVTLDGDKRISGVFAGDWTKAHREACARVKRSAMVPVPRRFPVVATSNSGFPLDQNLYQTVKGIAAAARVVEDGGTIFVASECSDGLPDHGRFGELLRGGGTPREILDRIRGFERPVLDQWQAHILCRIAERADVRLYSALPRDHAAAGLVARVEDLAAEVAAEVARRGGASAEVAVLPDGPLTIAYVEGEGA